MLGGSGVPDHERLGMLLVSPRECAESLHNQPVYESALDDLIFLLTIGQWQERLQARCNASYSDVRQLPAKRRNQAIASPAICKSLVPNLSI